MSTIQPLINGNRFSWTSIEVTLAGLPSYIGGPFKAINYTSKQEPGIVHGNSPRPLGRTRGQYEATGSFEMYRSEWQDFVEQIVSNSAQSNVGIHDIEFDITVQYAEFDPSTGGDNVITDVLSVCRISSLGFSNSQGSEPSTVSCDLSIMFIDYGDVASVADF